MASVQPGHLLAEGSDCFGHAQSRGRSHKGGGFVNDTGGYLTALDGAIASAKVQCEAYGVTEQSSLVVSVKLSIVDTPHILCERPEHGIRYGQYYLPAESDDSAWFLFSAVGMQAYEAAQTNDQRHAAWSDLHRLGPVEIHALDNVWSSTGEAGESTQTLLNEFIHAERNAIQVMLAESY